MIEVLWFSQKKTNGYLESAIAIENEGRYPEYI